MYHLKTLTSGLLSVEVPFWGLNVRIIVSTTCPYLFPIKALAHTSSHLTLPLPSEAEKERNIAISICNERGSEIVLQGHQVLALWTLHFLASVKEGIGS